MILKGMVFQNLKINNQVAIECNNLCLKVSYDQWI